MKVRTIVSSFRFGVRAAARSRLVLALLPLLAAATVALPLRLDADGTEAGALRMAVSWPLGAAFAILCVATLWTGGASIASEIERRRFSCDAVSPASALDIWLGRFLALVFLDAALLGCSLVAVFAVATVRAPEAARAPSRVVFERDLKYDEELAARLSGGDLRLAAAALEDLRSGAFLPVSPGEARAWRFKVPHREFDSVRIDFSLLSSYGVAQGVDGFLAVRPPTPGAPDIARFALSNDSDGVFSAELPASQIAGLAEIDVAFENAEDPETGAGALVSHTKAVLLSCPGVSFAGNLFRAFFVLLPALALAAALALLGGVAFSPPVAAFVSTALAVAVAASCGGSAAAAAAGEEHHHGEPRQKSVFEEKAEIVSGFLSGALGLAVRPIADADVIGKAGDGTAIRPEDAATAFFQCGVALPLLLGLAAAATLRRRELT